MTGSQALELELDLSPGSTSPALVSQLGDGENLYPGLVVKVRYMVHTDICWCSCDSACPSHGFQGDKVQPWSGPVCRYWIEQKTRLGSTRVCVPKQVTATWGTGAWC